MSLIQSGQILRLAMDFSDMDMKFAVCYRAGREARQTPRFAPRVRSASPPGRECRLRAPRAIDLAGEVDGNCVAACGRFAAAFPPPRYQFSFPDFSTPQVAFRPARINRGTSESVEVRPRVQYTAHNGRAAHLCPSGRFFLFPVLGWRDSELSPEGRREFALTLIPRPSGNLYYR